MSETYLENIYIENFRNLNESKIDFSKNINCISGNNGNGKTNLLEAIYYSIYKKSFRKNTKEDLIYKSENENYFVLKTDFYKDGKKFNHSMKIQDDEKQVYVNNQKNKRLERIKSVPINPYDSHIFYANKKTRRDLIDSFISDYDSVYKKCLSNFTKALRSRNSIIQKYLGPESEFLRQIKVYDKIISENAQVLIKKRYEFIEELNPILTETFNEIFREPIDLKIKYESIFEKDVDKEQIYNFYQSDISRDRMVKSTRRGIHLDDINILLNNKYCHEYGSIGQQKVSFLSLLFSYVGYLQTHEKITPILLIDDISGELDSLCLDNLLKYLERKHVQVFITTANEQFAKRLNNILGSKHYVIEKGKITELH